MKNMIYLTVACAGLISGAAQAQTPRPLECLQASAQSGSLAGCLNESGKGAGESVAADVAASRPAVPSLSVASLEARQKAAPRRVPTPTGYTDAEDGTVKAGFLKGLDSGYAVAAAAILMPAVSGLEAFGAPYAENIGTYFFIGLGTLLAIPAMIVGAVVGAPIGAAAGMIAETVSPGSTRDWFRF